MVRLLCLFLQYTYIYIALLLLLYTVTKSAQFLPQSEIFSMGICHQFRFV